MKRLRKWENEHGHQRHIRYFHSGEYGSNTHRPHYHAIIFGLDFRDKRFQFTRKTGKLAYPIYTSSTLSKIWPHGFHEIGAVTFESCAYVARYVLKKRNGSQKSHYDRVDTTTGEICRLQPEYSTMSRNPGIAKDWYTQFKRDVYPHGSVVHKGLELRPPRYYDTLFELEHPDLYERLKADRKAKAKESEKRGPSLESREHVHKQKLEKLVRGLR